jgi:hypothetical protein
MPGWHVVENISTIAGVLGAVVMLFQGARFWQQRREYRNKLKMLEYELDSDIIINLTGHPMKQFEEDWHKGKKIIDITVGNVDLFNLDAESDRVVKMILNEVKHELNSGVPIIFAFPGMSVLTQYLIAKIHGLAGVFPLITTPVKTGQGFVFTKPVDLQAIRTHKRFNRT